MQFVEDENNWQSSTVTPISITSPDALSATGTDRRSEQAIQSARDQSNLLVPSLCFGIGHSIYSLELGFSTRRARLIGLFLYGQHSFPGSDTNVDNNNTDTEIGLYRGPVGCSSSLCRVIFLALFLHLASD